MKAPTEFPAGIPSGKVNLAVQRPTVNVKEAENQSEQAAAIVNRAKAMTFSKHATFGPEKITHPGLENEE